MHSFAAAHQTSTAKLPIFFQKFKKRACRLSDNEIKPDTEMLQVKKILTLEVAPNQNVMKWACLEFLSKILTCRLTNRRGG